MAVEFLACGNVMSDRIQNEDGTFNEWNMGGPAFFALTGIRLWTDKVKLVSRTGADFEDTYAKWMRQHNVSMESVRYELANHNRFTLSYREDGSFGANPHQPGEHLGYLKTSPRDIDEACEGHNIKGMYLAQNTDQVFWEKLGKVKEKHGFKIMWEAEYLPKYAGVSREDFYDQIMDTLKYADMWSINKNEASHLFGIPADNDEDIINEIMKFPAEMMFYRVGNRGAYVITGNQAYFSPVIQPFGESVDPTGCGNNSTATSMYAQVSGYSPEEVGIIANISAGFNAAQKGPFKHYSDESVALANALAQELIGNLER